MKANNSAPSNRSNSRSAFKILQDNISFVENKMEKHDRSVKCLEN